MGEPLKAAERQGAVHRGPGGNVLRGKAAKQPQFSNRHLGRCLEEIRVGWFACGETVGSKQAERRSSFLKQEVYKLAWRMRIDLDLETALKKLDVERGRDLKASAIKNDLHYAIISAVLTPAELSPSQQTEHARTLTYAKRHKVPREYLIGFLKQIDKSALKQKLADPQAMEPWFDAALAQQVWKLYETRYQELENESGSGDNTPKTKRASPVNRRKKLFRKRSANNSAKFRGVRRARTAKRVS